MHKFMSLMLLALLLSFGVTSVLQVQDPPDPRPDVDSINEDVDPVGITEGPDPIPQKGWDGRNRF